MSGQGNSQDKARPDSAGPGTRIGPYKLLEPVGEGGFSVVWAAEQRQPVKRRVAVKIIKVGMDTKQVVARFEAERQALALMAHSNIAAVLDAGTTQSGRPYFVMELVRGIPITEYCDENKLSAKERLDLFIKVCHAIQHAHQKGIIHRDIKPSNILVTLHDGVPVPKVIDFGIAKATQRELTEKTLYTQLQQFLGTPTYTSPEQAEMSSLDIDTRSDIYSLGVLLYELLTGRTPFDAKELLALGMDEMRKTIREREPERPSTKVATLAGEDRTTTASRRRMDAPQLVSLLSGDLDWIVMKCLEKDRTRRYETADDLAMDLERHLKNEVVVARPPSTLYRLQKLVKRNKLVFASATVVTVALVIGLILTIGGMLQSRRALIHAEAFRTALEAQRLLGEGKITAAEERLEAIPPEALQRDLMADLLRGLGELHVRRGEWEAAARHFKALMEINGSRNWDASGPYSAEAPGEFITLDYLRYAPILIHLGNVQEYESFRNSLVERTKNITDPVYAERISRFCFLLPPDEKTKAAIKRWQKVIERGEVDPKPPNLWKPWKGVSLALLDQWQGNLEESNAWCERCLELQPVAVVRTILHTILARNYYSLDNEREGRRYLNSAARRIDEAFPSGSENNSAVDSASGDWIVDWYYARILYREAKELIDGLPAGG